MSGYVLHPDAYTDLDDIWEFIAEASLDAADRVREDHRRLAGDASGYDGCLCVDLAVPLRARGHAQCTADATIATYRAANDQWATGFDVAGQVAPLSYKCR